MNIECSRLSIVLGCTRASLILYLTLNLNANLSNLLYYILFIIIITIIQGESDGCARSITASTSLVWWQAGGPGTDLTHSRIKLDRLKKRRKQSVNWNIFKLINVFNIFIKFRFLFSKIILFWLPRKKFLVRACHKRANVSIRKLCFHIPDTAFFFNLGFSKRNANFSNLIRIKWWWMVTSNQS